MTTKQLLVLDVGLTPYDKVWALQRSAAQARIAGTLANDLLILCEHPPVVTLGRSTKRSNLLATPEYLASHGIEIRDVERGGDVTVHEPGQLVVYPIVDLKQHKQDLHWYLRQVEGAIIRALESMSLECTRVPGLTGVWRENRKLASIGVHARDWVTWHGAALNVCNDLDTFSHIVPCGIDQVVMTTVERECASAGVDFGGMQQVKPLLAAAFGELFGLEVADASPEFMNVD